MTSTALGYQMMIEQHLLSSMVSSESRNNFYIACAYAKTYASFLDVDKDKLPQTPLKSESIIVDSLEFQKHYFDLLMVICDKMKFNLKDVRERYGKGRNQPKVIESK